MFGYWPCVFWWGFAYVFAYFLAVRSRKCLENSLDVRSGVFWVRSLFLWFFSPTSFFAVFLRETVQVVTGHPLTRTCLACSFYPFVSRRFCLFRPFWPCVLLLGGLSGCHSGPRAFFGILLVLVLRPLLLDARRQGCFRASCDWFFFFPLCYVLRPHFF